MGSCRKEGATWDAVLTEESKLVCPHFDSFYVFGGKDLKEGSFNSLWCVDVSKIFVTKSYEVEWELVETTGKGPSKYVT